MDFVIIRGLISIKVASFLINKLKIDSMIFFACFFCLSFKSKTLIIFSKSFWLTSFFKSNLVLIIFSGCSFATFSISTPPSVLLIKAIFEVPLSTKQERYNSL
jgi:hypothetical protein